ncbi:hypothetical protein PHYBLDRAFT_144247 [Phycomyces blakesleeanus NRRL 1555(-)]|uniref:Uncharacterized protein n=1 Tax=Phycomyces blakesleeanus (strain ATCC 8743b / DSM 1359 / FGSC 10004 / NBRC 33097 / NRRL 1555) TaxID=763407 RepID=A0A162UAZ0_PHYB8|nr:hypothetical protein PHYBLDRAFT_144247 [Phycomyces blakesleeanus NRRL 1555(-)]OAD74892.1 hypothetical protein PHYBLDRAFT_144247 [Phycomyces blakesleeanus NRRL 1555(-)]|eukprot:XP_018292932.1 hypothetical protein PHYBLDRAFT_144247 [Phycomyces blakesleeanus NRRL 1555(-)]
MPPASKKSKLAKSKSQSESGNCFFKNIETSNNDLIDLFEIDIEEDITVDDRELQGIADDVTSAIYSSHFLKWHEEADKSLLESVNEELKPVEATSRKISANTISLLKLAFNNIKEEIASFICISDSSLPVDYYELCKLKSVESYLRYRLSESKTMEASKKAAMELWLLWVTSQERKTHQALVHFTLLQ